MKLFSERKGLKKVSEIIQTESMNDELRVSLWNVLELELWSTPCFFENDLSLFANSKPDFDTFRKLLWVNHFKQPIDRCPDLYPAIMSIIRTHFFNCQWNEVYDFLEFVVSYYGSSFIRLVNSLNYMLERELSGYRFVDGHLADITDKQELEMLDEALRDTRFTGVTAHLQRALELYADRKHPDYRNSIKESISAVESMARVVSGKSNATLGDALKVIEKKGALHSLLKEGFIKLYGYTNDEHGIRHAMLEEPSLTAADARFFLLSCTSFVNYLKAQLP